MSSSLPRQDDGGITNTALDSHPLPAGPCILLPCLHPYIKVVTHLSIQSSGLFLLDSCLLLLPSAVRMIKIITIKMIISELQSLGVCLLESCLLPCRRLSPTPSKVSRIDPNPFLHNITCQLIVSLSLITGLLASYICCALYLLHTETSSR